ncbi:unnamed protein product [Acanthoscelides obtectus]|uniref:Uncharacterized protein n=1 Tax=Acanthoscelides obtectus TaxID=200917 RepID=A0A9P0LJR3_ACAOB|nr:unnamed protein product [Acanthoscelides obtectus]CAK1660843.1 hypothetical protein AOBTE_LOCUS22293 [Acanthoscelides obtectus]
MPHRKRYRRYRRKKQTFSDNANHVEIVDKITSPLLENNSVLEPDNSPHHRTVIESLKTPAHHTETTDKQWNNEITTPVNNSNYQESNHNAYNTLTTPVNMNCADTTPTNKDCTPKRRHGSLNVTNLNVLFTSNVTYNDLDQLYETPTLTKNMCLQNQVNENISIRRRSRSYTPKAHCPVKEKSMHVDKGTQIDVVEPEATGQLLEKRCNEVFDTPKHANLPHFSRLERSQSNIDKKQVIYGSEININPYLKSVEGYLGKNVDSSFPEIFFSPKLLENKLSSTPIERSAQRKPDIGAAVVDISNAMRDFTGHIGSPNLKINSLVGDKVKHKEDSIRDFRLNVSRRSFTLSPKSLARVSKLNRSRRSTELGTHVERSIGSIENQERFFTKLRRYGRNTRSWSSRIISLCQRIGSELRNGLQSLCNLYNPGNVTLNLSVNRTNNDEIVECNKCVEYKVELDRHAREIENNKREIENNRKEIENERREKDRLSIRIEQQQDELVKLKENLKEIQNRIRSCPPPPPPPCPTSFPPPPPPLPNPPPPPPPPLPPLSLTAPSSTSLKITKNEKNGGGRTAAQPRPVISLEDILKVKLKKASDRCGSTPTGRFAGTRRASATVPLETLEQVRLRPTPRLGGNLPSEGGLTTPTTGDPIPTSPMTAMCRMLKADSAAAEL